MTAGPDPATAGGELADELEGGFSRRALGWIIASVSVSFLAALLLTVYGRDLDWRPAPGAHTFSDSALGHRALMELLAAMGLGARARQAPAGGVGPHWPLVLAEPDFNTVAAGRLQALRDEARASAAPLVTVLTKWSPGAAREDKPEWLAKVRLRSENQVLARLDELGIPGLDGLAVKHLAGKGRCTAVWRPGEPPVEFAVDLEPAQLFVALSPGLEPMVNCGAGFLMARRAATAESPQLVLIADPDLLNNHGLGRAEHASMVYQLLTRALAAEGAVFDETIHGFNRTPGLLTEASSFPLVLGVLQSLLLLGVVLWGGMGRFGKPLPAAAALAAGKEILIDNTAKLLAGGGHAADGLLRYFRQTTRAVGSRYFLPPELPDGERLARLQRITDGRGAKLSLAELERSIWRLPAGRRGEEQAARIARRLYQWRVEMTNGHRESP